MTESWQELTSLYPRTFALIEPALQEEFLRKFLAEWQLEDGEKQEFLFPMFLRSCGLSPLAEEVLSVEVSLAQATRSDNQQAVKAQRNFVRVELSGEVFGLPVGLYAIGNREGKSFFVRLNALSALILEILEEGFVLNHMALDWSQLRGQILRHQLQGGKSYSQEELDAEFFRLLNSGLLMGVKILESSLAQKATAGVEEGIFPLS